MGKNTWEFGTHHAIIHDLCDVRVLAARWHQNKRTSFTQCKREERKKKTQQKIHKFYYSTLPPSIYYSTLPPSIIQHHFNPF